MPLGQARHTECACTCVIQKHVHLRPCRIAFAVGGDDDEAVGRGRGAKDRGPADRQRLDLSSTMSHAGVIDAADLGDELARQRQAELAIRPRRLAPPPSSRIARPAKKS